MPGPKRRQEPPVSVRFPKALHERVKLVAIKLGYTEAEVIRLGTAIGLEHLRRIDFKLEGAIIDASQYATQVDEPTARVAEDSQPGATGKKAKGA